MDLVTIFLLFNGCNLWAVNLQFYAIILFQNVTFRDDNDTVIGLPSTTQRIHNSSAGSIFTEVCL